MVQGGDETITSYETRLKPIARTGKFKEQCSSCSQEVDFTEQMVLDHLIRGLADEAIQIKVLAMNDKDITLTKVIFVCRRILEQKTTIGGLGKRQVVLSGKKAQNLVILCCVLNFKEDFLQILISELCNVFLNSI